MKDLDVRLIDFVGRSASTSSNAMQLRFLGLVRGIPIGDEVCNTVINRIVEPKVNAHEHSSNVSSSATSSGVSSKSNRLRLDSMRLRFDDFGMATKPCAVEVSPTAQPRHHIE